MYNRYNYDDSGYRIASICQNGHCSCSSLETTIPDEKFCELCGAEIITQCPSCGTPIRGKYHFSGLLDLTSFPVPNYCFSCGQPFPWTRSAIEAATALITEEESLDSIQRETLIASLPDIVSETPKTQLAVARVKKGLAIAGKFTADALRQFVLDFGCELAKKQLGL